MKIKIKTLKSITYELDIDNSHMSISDLKSLIEEKHGFESEYIKLLFNGVVLDDKKEISDYPISDNSVLIIMTSKIKKKNEEMAHNPVEKKAEETKDIKEITEEKKSEAKDSGKTDKASNNKDKDNNIVEIIYNNKEGIKDNLQRLKLMGFKEAEAKNALERNDNDFKKAMETLVNELPVEEDFSDQGFTLNPEMLDNFDLTAPDALNNICSILKILINQNPYVLQEILEEFGETNPEIFDFIKENEGKFKELMAEPINDHDYTVLEALIGKDNIDFPGVIGIPNDQEHDNEHDEEDAEEYEEADLNDPVTTEELMKDFSDADKASVNNITNMGFSKIDAIMAYIACEKNEEKAINLLLSDMN